MHVDFNVTVVAHHMRLQWLLLMQAWGLITPAEDQELLQLIPAFQAAAWSHHVDAQLIPGIAPPVRRRLRQLATPVT